MKSKKTTLIAILVIVLLLFSACTSNNMGNTKTDSLVASTDDLKEQEEKQSLLTETGTYPIVNETVTLDIFIQNPGIIEDFETNDFTLYLEELTGIDLEFVEAPKDTAVEKLNLLMASRQYPSLIIGGGVDLEKYGVEEGLLIDVSTLIEKHMPNLSSELEKRPLILKQLSSSNGKLYAFPSLNECYHCGYSDKMWVNTTIMENIGATIPTTTEEFYETCKLYKEQYPDGIALAGGAVWNGDPTLFLSGSFTYYPVSAYGTMQSQGLRLNGDTVETMITSDGYKELLKYMKKLYEEGLLDEGIFTMNYEQVVALVASEEEPVLFIPCGYSGGFIDSAAMPELYSHYYAIAPLSGPEDVQYVSAFTYSSPGADFVITDACENLEVVARLVDFFYTPEAYLIANYGEEGMGWRYAEENELGLDGSPGMYKLLTGYETTNIQNKTWIDAAPKWATSEFLFAEVADPNIDIHNPDNLQALLFKTTYELYEPYYQETYRSIPPVTFTNDESEAIATISVELQSYINQSKVDFVTGAIDIDNGWTAYSEAINNIGIKKLIEVYQIAYDRRYK